MGADTLIIVVDGEECVFPLCRPVSIHTLWDLLSQIERPASLTLVNGTGVARAVFATDTAERKEARRILASSV